VANQLREARGSANARGALGISLPGRLDVCRPRAGATESGCSREGETACRWNRLANYQAKWANALLASAMRCTLSRLVTAAPSRL